MTMKTLRHVNNIRYHFSFLISCEKMVSVYTFYKSLQATSWAGVSGTGELQNNLD